MLKSALDGFDMISLIDDDTGLSWYVYDAAQVIPSKLKVKTPSLSLFLFFRRSIRPP
jgi:hypothetical protein